MFKRTLSESSTGSEGESEGQRDANGRPSFKIPRLEPTPGQNQSHGVATGGVGATIYSRQSSGTPSPAFRPGNPAYFSPDYVSNDSLRQLTSTSTPKYERRESEASTASTATSRSSMSETDEDYADGEKISTVSFTYFSTLRMNATKRVLFSQYP